MQYQGGTSALYLQREDGTFDDASDRLVAPLAGPGLVLLATDLDEDGKIDLFLGNDLPSNYDRYFRNLGGGAFSEIGMSLGVAYSARPSGLSSMSANDPDFDRDGHLDLIESSWEGESDGMFKCSGSSAAK